MNETNVLIISRDISESVKAERERVEMEAQLLQSQKMETIGTLAGGIAHDFNNILQAIRGYVDMAREEIPAHSPAQEDLEHVTRAVSRAKNLVRQILTFSRQSAQDFKVIAIQNIIREAVEMLRAIVPSQIEIECRLQEDCGPVHADPTQIQQVVINLCNNASQSMLPDGGFITIELDAFVADADFASLHADMQPGSFARITISDTGHGMDAVTLPRIFEPFFTTKNVGEGTGLGLSVVHGIVANHKGSIIVQSEPEHGSTFQIFLPFASTTAIKDKELKTSPKERPRKNILFVDDDEAVAQLGKKYLIRQVTRQLLSLPA